MNTEKPTTGSDQLVSADASALDRESDQSASANAPALACREVVIQNQVGLYARPATYFIQKANEFKSSVWVEKDERRVNAKSLLGILSLGVTSGTTIKIIADGPDRQEAVDSLEQLVNSGFSQTNDQKSTDTFDKDVMNSNMQSSG